MSTPDFVPQNDSNFTPIRYYTAADPYFYTVDNRPLQDIETNLKASRSGGADAARRAAILGSLNLAAVMADLYSVPSDSSAARVMTGLAVSYPSANTVQVGPGAVYELRQISASVTDNVMKMALATKSNSFTLTSPVTAGTSIIYTIEGTFVELISASMSSSLLPVMDSTNAYLPSTLIHGELQLSLNTGTAAPTASVTPPATTSGKFPLYNVMLTQGSSVPVITAHANSPYVKGLHHRVVPVSLATGGATIGLTYEMPSITFVDGSTTGVALPIGATTATLNPYKPINVKLTLASTISGGAATFRLRYSAFGPGDALGPATNNTSMQAVTINNAGNVAQTNTLSINVPSTAFSGLNGTNWSVIKDKISIVLERVGADATDTNTGSIIVLNATLIQA